MIHETPGKPEEPVWFYHAAVAVPVAQDRPLVRPLGSPVTHHHKNRASGPNADFRTTGLAPAW